MAENFNPYGSAISRSNLFVYDPNPFMAKTLDKGQKELQKGLDELVATRRKEVQYANDILNNLGSLKDQAELEHNNFINARVDTLIEQVKGNMTKKGKLGLVSFNFNNPEFQLQLRQGVNQIKRGINNSKLLKDQYDDFVKFLNINKDVVSNQVDLLNRASQNVTNPVNIFTANDPTIAFTNLKNEAIDERKFISQTAQDILQTSGGPNINYVATDAEGKPVTVTGKFNENLYVLDDTGFNILKDDNGKPLINNTYVETVKEDILKSTNIKSVTDWLNNPDNNEEFVRILTSDLDIKIQTKLDRLNIELAETRVAKAKKDLEDEETTSLSDRFTVTSFKTVKVGGDEVQDNVRIHQFAESKVIKEKATDGLIQGQDIKAINGIGHNVLGEKVVYLTGINGKKIAIKEGTKLVDIVDAKNLSEDLKKYILTKEDILRIYNLARDSYFEKLDAKEKNSFIDVLERTKLFDVTDRNPIGIDFGEEQDE